MAQYHFAAVLVCRSKGQSSVAAAAYRAGAVLEDERLGKTFDYRRRGGVLHTEIHAPDNTPGWMLDRLQLWNAVEKVEKRKDSQLARSLDIALPHELTFEQNLELVRDFVREQFVSRGMIADFAIHAPGRKGDIRNVHVHILLTTRELAGAGFGAKVRDWNRKEELQGWREAWANHANRILEREGFEERIDHRSLSDQGIDREPTTHIGPDAKEMEERGDHSDRAQQNRDIKAANENLELLRKELAESQTRLIQLRRQLADERMEQIQKTVRAVDPFWDKAEQRQAPTPERPAEPEQTAKQPEPSRLPPRRPPSAAERMEQIQEIVRAVDPFWDKAEQRQAPAPERPAEPPPPAKELERPAKQPEPSPPRTPPVPSGPAPRPRQPSRYDIIDKQNYAERAAKAAEEERKKQEAERDRDKDERERKPDRER